MSRIDTQSPEKERDQKDLIDAAWRQVERVRSTFVFGFDTSADGQRIRIEQWTAGRRSVELPGYRIDGEIHRGGQGVVYRGVQHSTGRTVAIKVMLGGPFAGPRQRARFEREVQILASLRHPNIVTIHDSGEAAGVAYFVMDYIAGAPLDEHVSRAGLGLAARLELFASICEAVNAAHLRGVLHRDLKPHNVRVDEEGAPHVLDFGLAKQADWQPESPEEQAAMTQTGQFLGSLPWASPEQAAGQADIDVRTDVYSLGVMLYQLLTGAFPYPIKGTLAEVTQHIIHSLPRSPRALDRSIDDDAATIALKALHKERELRYQTAGALALDIRRYLAGEPIEAKRDSLTYVIKKHVSRHKWVAAVACAFLLVITAGLVTSGWFWRMSVVARRAEAERAETATQQATRAEAVAKFVSDMISSGNPVRGGKADLSVREAIDAAVRRLDAGALADHPDQEAAARNVIGKAYGGLGLYAEGLAQLRIARRLSIETDAGETPISIEALTEIGGALHHLGRANEAEDVILEAIEKARATLGENDPLVAQLLNGLGDIARDRGRYEQAEQHSFQALEAARAAGASPRDEATILNDLALALEKQNKLGDATEAQRHAVELYRQELGDHHYLTGIALSNLAGLYVKTGDEETARSMYIEALDILRTTGGQRHPNAAHCLGALGLMYLKQRDFERAAPLLQESADIRLEVLGSDHQDYGLALNNLALADYHLDRVDLAEERYLEALRIYRATRGDDHPSIAQLLGNLAGIQRGRGDVQGALPVLRDVLDRSIAQRGESHPATSLAMHNLGQTLADDGQLEEAETLLREALAVRRKAFGNDSVDTANTVDALAGVLIRRKQVEEAETHCREALQIRRDRLGSDHLDVADSLNNLALVLSDTDRNQEALPHAEEAIAIVTARLPEGHWKIPHMQGNRGAILVRLGRYAEAEAVLNAAYERLSRRFTTEDPRVAEFAHRYVALYTAWGKPKLAEEWRRPVESSALLSEQSGQ